MEFLSFIKDGKSFIKILYVIFYYVIWKMDASWDTHDGENLNEAFSIKYIWWASQMDHMSTKKIYIYI